MVRNLVASFALLVALCTGCSYTEPGEDTDLIDLDCEEGQFQTTNSDDVVVCQDYTVCDQGTEIARDEVTDEPVSGDRVCCHLERRNDLVIGPEDDSFSNFENECLVVENDLTIKGSAPNEDRLILVRGRLTVEDYSDTNLGFLTNLLETGGALHFENMTGVDDLSDLGSLRAIGQSVALDVVERNESIRIEGTSLKSLNGLQSITSIDGLLLVRDNDELKSLDGLQNLEEATSGGVILVENQVLRSLNGLKNLGYIEGDLGLSENDALKTMDGLQKLSEVTGDLYVKGAEEQESFAGLSALTSIGGSLIIFEAEALKDFRGLDALTSIGGDLDVRENEELFGLYGLGALTTVQGDVRISDNERLEHISDMEELKVIGGELDVTNNELLCGYEVEDVWDGLTNKAVVDVTNNGNKNCPTTGGTP